MSFDKLNLIAPIRKALDEKGYLIPTPIQVQAIPYILRGRDIIGCWQGKGKTAAYIIPIIQNLLTDEIPEELRGHPRVLLLCSKWELATHMKKSFDTYGKYSGLKCEVGYDKDSNDEQQVDLFSETDILIATPNILMNLINTNSVILDKIEIFVMDETDKMLAIGFSNELNEIKSRLPEKKQTLLFYNSESVEIGKLSSELLRDPVEIVNEEIPQTQESTPTAGKIRQAVYFINSKSKIDLLLHLIKEEEIQRAIVFIKSKDTAKTLTEVLNKEGISSQTFHGKISPFEREIRLTNLRTNKIRVLVSTDVATNGVDIDNVTHVINFEMPPDPDIYFKRINLTGKNGSTGFALSFCDDNELKFLERIELTVLEPITVVENHPYVIERHNSIEAKPVKSKKRVMENDFQYDYITAKASYVPEPPVLVEEEPEGKKKRPRIKKVEQTFMSSSVPKEKNKDKKLKTK